MIESINNFPSILSLHTLSICNNSLNDLNKFINAAITKFPRLRSLNTLTNPINPGMTNPQGYNQYKNYMKYIQSLTELDGMNINDNSYMNQGQQSSQPKRDLFGTSGAIASNPSPSPKVDFFSNSATTTNQTMTQAPNSNMFTSMNQNMTQAQPPKQKMGLFDNMPSSNTKTLSQSVMVPNYTQRQNDNYDININTGKVFRRQMFTIDENEELDGTEFVLSKKKKSTIMVNEKIFKKSDNMTNFNRKNRSEGNKHILNKEL